MLKRCRDYYPHTSTQGQQSPVPPLTSSVRRTRCNIRKQRLNHPLGPIYLSTHQGLHTLPENITRKPIPHRNHMCPTGLALHHPAAATLLQYAAGGCPVQTGKPSTKHEMQAAIDRGPLQSALAPGAIDQLHEEVATKVRCGQARIVDWNNIKDDPP